MALIHAMLKEDERCSGATQKENELNKDFLLFHDTDSCHAKRR